LRRSLRIHAAAAEEAAEAAAWYEKERPGLGADFEKAVNAAMDILEQEVVPLVHLPGVAGVRGLKRLLLRRFPYSIVVQQRNAEIVVIAVAHQARRPGYWRERVKR
jgi:toxin ParE1/3/4